MSLLINVILFGIGLWILTKASDYLVEGASSVASKLKIKPIVIGLTIVAFGTSTPELVVSVTSALSGYTDIALGNVVGSNIFNILIILGISAIIYPIHIKKNTFWKEIPFSLLAALLVLFFTGSYWFDGENKFNVDFGSPNQLTYLTASQGLILLSVFAIFMYYIFGIAKSGDVEEVEIKDIPIWQSILFIVGGLVGLSLAAKYLVTDTAVFIAQTMGLPETLIGLTIVSVGTSLPELATSVTAAFKKNSDIAIGNVVGSNLFNILFVLAATVLIRRVPISGQNIFDIIFLTIITIVLFILIFVLQKFKLNKLEGISMVVIYIAYMAYLVIRSGSGAGV